MSSDLREHFFYKTDSQKPSLKATFCTGSLCEKGTVKVVWIPYNNKTVYPDKYDEDEKPTIRPGAKREELKVFRYWLICIARWKSIATRESYLVEEEGYLTRGIVDYPLGLLYNPEKEIIEKVTFRSERRFDYDLYQPHGKEEFSRMKQYFKGYISREVKCEDFREWFFDEEILRIEESYERFSKRKENKNSNISYAMRGYWFDPKPKES